MSEGFNFSEHVRKEREALVRQQDQAARLAGEQASQAKQIEQATNDEIAKYTGLLHVFSTQVVNAALNSKPPVPFDGEYRQYVGLSEPKGLFKKTKHRLYDTKSGWVLASSHLLKGGPRWNDSNVHEVKGTVLCTDGVMYHAQNEWDHDQSYEKEDVRVRALNGAELESDDLSGTKYIAPGWTPAHKDERPAEGLFKFYVGLLTQFAVKHELEIDNPDTKKYV